MFSVIVSVFELLFCILGLGKPQKLRIQVKYMTWENDWSQGYYSVSGKLKKKKKNMLKTVWLNTSN